MKRPVALVADEDTASKDAVCHALDRIGLDMVHVENGQDALSVFFDRRPNLVLVSADLPGMDGISLTEAVRALPGCKMLPILIVAETERLSADCIERAFQNGVTDIIQRPRNWTLFSYKISHLLRTLQVEQDLQTTHSYMCKAIDLFPGGFTIFDPEGRLVVANGLMRKRVPNLQLGMTVQSVWEHAHDSGLMETTAESRQTWLQQQMDAMKAERWWEIPFKDGRYMRYLAKSFEDGSMFCVSLDVTEERIAERKLIASRQEAEDANRIKAQFLSGMSHEVRTPLNAIIGFSDIISNELMGKIANRSYVEYARDINRSGQHLLEILTLILDISKIETGRDVLVESEFVLSQVISSATRRACQSAEEKSIHMDVAVDQDLAILGDESRLARAFHCVLDNAIKFSPNDSQVFMGARLQDETIDLWVRDQGIGMTDDDLPQAFMMFSQLEEAPSRRFSGMGIGLAYAKTIVEGHGGKVVMDTRVNEGTHVTFRLPIKRLCGAQSNLGLGHNWLAG